jgi:hypothetical protein
VRRSTKAAGAAAAVEFAPEFLIVLLIVLLLFLIWYYGSKLADFFSGWTFTAKSLSNGTFTAAQAWDSFVGYGKSMANSLAGKVVDSFKISSTVGG